jgi:hypothetical protein
VKECFNDTSEKIHAPVEQVYALARDPKRWATWFVGLGEPAKVTGGGEVGTIVEHSYLLAGMRLPVTTCVLEDHIGPEGGRWKATIGEPFVGEQTLTYTPRFGDTEVTIEVDYIAPGKAIGELVDRRIIKRITELMELNAEHTIKNLRMLCGGEPVLAESDAACPGRLR